MKPKGAAAVIEAHGLQFKATPCESNPFMPQPSEDMKHWFCSFSGAEVPLFEFYVSMGEEAAPEDGVLDGAVALALVAEDVRSYRECEGYADFAKLLGIEENDDTGRVAFEEIGRLASIMEQIAEKKPASAPQAGPESAA